MEEINFKDEVRFLEEIIKDSEVAIGKHKKVIEKANEVLTKIQSKCKHDFELQGYHAGAVFECKKCGFIGAA